MKNRGNYREFGNRESGRFGTALSLAGARHMRLLLAGLGLAGMLAGMLTAGSAYAGALTGERDGVHALFNAQAVELDAENRMLLTECGKLTCNYMLTGELAGIASSPKEAPDEVESFTLIFGKGSDGASMIISMGILMMVYSPQSDQEERAAALTRLAKGISEESDNTSVILGKTSYTISNVASMGIWFIVEGR